MGILDPHKIIAAIDAANTADPNLIDVGGVRRPAELVYGERMTRVLERLCPDASAHLRIAARGQHIERWSSPRAAYPQGRVGYLKWRKDLKDYHARRLGEIMAAADCAASDIARVQALVRKERLKYDAEAQALEDVICVVFLEDYFADFSEKHDAAKVIDILRKTWAKMSPSGHAAALALSLPKAARTLVERALSAHPGAD